MELDSPRKQEPVGKLAEVEEECFFFSVYYLLVGRKSGRKISQKNARNFVLLLKRMKKNVRVQIDIAQTRQPIVVLIG